MRTALLCFTIFITFSAFSLAANTEYTVKQGDTLYDIAKRHDTSVSKIKQLNNLQSSNLSIGSTILVPSNVISYKVKSGDTLGGIAVKFGLTSSKEIIEFNGLSGSFVKVGQTLRIPAKGAPVETVAAKPEVKKQTVPKPASSNSSYKVVGGDSLYSIAIKHGTTVDNIKSLNNLSGNNLKIGQELLISGKPAPQKKEVKDESREVVVEVGPTNIYKVKSGDTVGQIAENFGVSTKDLKSHNNLNSNNIRVGQELKIPSGSSHSIIIVQKPKSLEPTEENLVTVKEPPKPASGIKLPTVEEPKVDKVETVSLPTAAKNVAPEPTVTYHTVQSGDTLGDIAVKYNLRSSKDIIDANGLQTINLSIGQKLLIPSGNTHTVIADAAPSVSNQKNKKIAKPAVKKTIDNKTFTGSYTVRSGDTVSQIAEKFNIKTTELKQANNLRSNNIRVGQKLSVPKTTSNLIAKSRPKDQVYKVRRGDTLSSISRKFGVSVSSIKRYNGLSSSRLDIGDKLRIPDSALTITKSGQIRYKVIKGDSLLKIANNFNITVSSLKSANGLNSNRINVGDKLIIPPTPVAKAGSKSTTRTAKSSKKTRNTTTINYRVRGGDTLSSIARKHNSSVTKIKQANNLISNNIYSGQRLKVPSSIHAAKSDSATKKKRSYANDREIADDLIREAKRYLGAPYKFGGTSTKTGIDCSAYVNKVFRSFNVNLPRTARGIYKKGNHVSKSKLQKGDLVFFRTYAQFPSHVGIYMGNGKFIHASSAKKKVIITNLHTNYYTKRYIGAKRIKIDNAYAKNAKK